MALKVHLYLDSCFEHGSKIFSPSYNLKLNFVGVSALTLEPVWTLVPVLSICIYIVGFSMGFGSLPWFMTAELLPKEAQSWATSCVVEYSFFLSFVVLKLFIHITNILGSGFTFCFISVLCVVGILFVYFCVPETKCKSADEIQALIKLGLL